MSKPNIENIYPLTPMQEGMLYHELYDPNSRAYFQQISKDLGHVDAEVLVQACQLLFARHAILRTFFVWKKREKPIQIVRKSVDLPLREVDLSDLTPEQQASELAEQARADREAGFVLDKAPLVRLVLFRLAPDRYRFSWSNHHILMDGLCRGLLIDELITLYERLLRGENTQLPKPRHFRDYVAWLGKQDRDRARAYWQETLAGLEEASPVPGDNGFKADDVIEPKAIGFTLSSQERRQLEQYAASAQVTLANLVQGFFGLLLTFYSGEQEAVFGQIVSGRPESLSGSADMIGLFINMLPVRVRTSPDTEMTSWLQQYQADRLRMREFEHLALIDVQGESDVPRGNPLFLSAVSFLAQGNALEPTMARGPAQVQAELMEYPLVLIVQADKGLDCAFHYHANRVDGDVVQRMVGFFHNLLTHLKPGEKHLQRDLLRPMPQDLQLLEAVNRTDKPELETRNLTTLFEVIVATNPDAPAVLFEGQTLSYRELNNLANQMAHVLVNLGVRPGQCVGVFMERSQTAVISFLAILKVGAVYVSSFNKKQPTELIAYMIEDSRIQLLLTQSHLAAAIPAKDSLQVCCVDQLTPELASCETTFQSVNLGPQAMAYLLYTSGSTGSPKGAMISHRNIIHVIRDSKPGILPQDRMIQQTSLSFDPSMAEIWGALLNGAALCIYPEQQDTIEERIQFLDEQQISVLIIAAPLFHRIAATAGNSLPHLRKVLVGGDVMLPALCRQFQARCPQVDLYNVYGPTEATVYASLQPLIHPLPDTPIPIGKPLPDSRFQVLGNTLDRVPVGGKGQLFIAGEGLGFGYWNRPKHTACAFLPNPYSNRPGDRLYASGDRGAYNHRGELLFHGRLDFQVKIRGYRVEPGEIEAGLTSHTAVKEALVLPRSDAAAGVMLVAYLTLQDGETVSRAELKDHIAARVPEYMVPAAFMILEQFPLQHTGKVNRKALPEPDRLGVATVKQVAPVGEDEIIMTEIWKDLFGMPQISMEDNFFDLGGHSLLATQLIDKVRHGFEIQASLREFLEKPTPSGFMEVVQNARETQLLKKTAEEPNDQEEIQLDRTVWPPMEVAMFCDQPKAVLLTGATGFVGAFLLNELLQQTPARVYCLVRGTCVEQARQRVTANLHNYGLTVDLSRIEVVLGDLSQPCLGVEKSIWHHLSTGLDAIYHNGALVHFLYPYSQLKPANVLGVQEVLRLAVEGRLKPVHYISTLAVLRSSSNYRKGLIYEDDDLEDGSQLTDGYVRSKWAGEKLMRMAEARGIPMAIYRVGRVTGDSQSGACDVGSMLMRTLRSYVQLGIAPILNDPIDMIPVDYLCRSIVHLSRNPDHEGLAFHLENPQKISHSDLVSSLNEFGYDIKPVPYPQWYRHLKACLERGEENALKTLFTVLPAVPDEIQANESQNLAQVPNLSERGLILPDQTNVTRGLAHSEIGCPVIDRDLLRTYVNYLVKQDALPSFSSP